MKLNLLLATSLITGAAFGQFTQANEPALAATATMYVLDSNAVNYSAVTGTGVIWDYSTTPGVSGATKTVSVIDPSGTTNFSTSTKGIQIPEFITSYFTSTPTQRISQGFSFEDPNAGAIDVVLSTDPELLMNYTFSQGNTLTDAFSGNAYTTFPSPLDVIPTSGSVTATVDGTGTLKLGNSIDLTNVTRYKIVETATANAGFLTVNINRIQFEYYDLANSNLPVFVHSQLTIDMGSPTTQSLVMSTIVPDEYLNVSGNNKTAFGLYPNPANESVVISGLTGNETIAIVDMAGRTVLTAQNSGTTQTLNVADFQAGIYNVVITANGIKSTKKLTIN